MKKTFYLLMLSVLFLPLLFQGCGFMVPGNPQTDEQETAMSPISDTPSVSPETSSTTPAVSFTPVPDMEARPPEPSQSPETPYSIYRETYRHFEYDETYGSPGNFSLWYYQITGLDDPVIESLINKELKAAVIDWQVDDDRDVATLGPGNSGYGDDDGIYQEGHYLWASYWFSYIQARRYGIFNIRVTIDMETGKRVFLDDLIDMSTDFLQRIRDDDIAAIRYPGSGESIQVKDDKYVRDWLMRMSDEELLSFLDSCQMDNATWKQCQENGGNYHDDLNGFYLNDGELILFRSALERRLDIAFKLDDIEEFLKVPKW